MGSVSFVEACTRLFSPVSLPTWMNELFMWRHRFLENLSFHLSQRFLCSWDRMRKKKKQKTKNKKIKKQRNKETMKQRNNETKKQRNKSLDKKKFDYSQNKCGKYCSALNSQSILNLPSYWSRGVFFLSYWSRICLGLVSIIADKISVWPYQYYSKKSLFILCIQFLDGGHLCEAVWDGGEEGGGQRLRGLDNGRQHLLVREVSLAKDYLNVNSH